MTDPIRSVCGNYYAGMTKNEADSLQIDSKNIVISFDQIDKNKDAKLSEQEIIESREIYTNKQKKKGETLTTIGYLGMFAGTTLAIASGAVTAPIWFPYAAGVALVSGIVSWYSGLVADKKAENVEKETEKYNHEKQRDQAGHIDVER